MEDFLNASTGKGKKKAEPAHSKRRQKKKSEQLSPSRCVEAELLCMHSHVYNYYTYTLVKKFNICIWYSSIHPISSTSSLSSYDGDDHIRHGKRPKAAHYKRRLNGNKNGDTSGHRFPANPLKSLRLPK